MAGMQQILFLLSIIAAESGFSRRGVLTLTADKVYPPEGCRGWIIDQLVVIEVLTVVVEAILVMRRE